MVDNQQQGSNVECGTAQTPNSPQPTTDADSIVNNLPQRAPAVGGKSEITLTDKPAEEKSSQASFGPHTKNIQQSAIVKEKKYLVSAANFLLERDLIVNPDTTNHLEEALAKIKWHRKIYEEWNFASVDPLGRTSILNFYGPPGTGKTMAAEAIAGTLGLEIIKISIAELESKYMGETAQNIQAAFLQAGESGSILFFDEADTLLGKRLSSVTQGIDNEVNSMRSTLLIELEKFDGIVIFATNFAKNYDEAFRSRISHHVPFNLPDLETRRRLLERMLLPSIPIAGARADLISHCATITDGFSGREIRTCMRLALPMALIEAELESAPAALGLTHLEKAIQQIKEANKHVASTSSVSMHQDLEAAKGLLGMQSKRKE